MGKQNNLVVSFNFNTTRLEEKIGLIVNQASKLSIDEVTLHEFVHIIVNEFSHVFLCDRMTTTNADGINVITGFLDLSINDKKFSIAYPAFKGCFNHINSSNCRGD